MVQNGDDKEDKFDAFTAEGEALGYISLEQARVLAMQHARDNRDFYGPAYSRINLVWEVIGQEEGEDYYDIKLSFRPAGRFRGEPGVEQFIIEKTGSIEIRQILDEPTGLGQPRRARPRWLLPATVVLVGVVGAVALLIVFAVIDSGLFDGSEVDKTPQALVDGATPRSTPGVKATATPGAERPATTKPPPSLSPGSLSLAQLRQLLLSRIEEVAPRLPRPKVEELASAVLAEAQATGKTSFAPDEINGFVSLALAKLNDDPTEGPGDASGQKFNLLMACFDRSLKQCEVLQDFGSAVFDRTDGRVEIRVASFAELGVAGSNALQLVADGKPQLAEVYGGWFSDELPILDLAEMWGLYPNTDGYLKVFELGGDEVRRRIEKRSNSVVILENYYPGPLFFSNRPLRNPGDFKGLKIHSSSQATDDLIEGLGGEPQFISQGDLHAALERGIIDGVVAGAQSGFRLKLYEVSKYMVGPLQSAWVNWLIMNRDQWDALPTEFQEIIREQAALAQEKNLRLSTTEWLGQEIQQNIDQGMEYTELSPALRNAFREATVLSVLPNWVKRVGGPDSPEVSFYNEQVAPIVEIEVKPDGTAADIGADQPPVVRRPIPTGPEVNFLGTGVVGDDLRFDVDRFSVKRGSVVVMTLKNASQVNQHNWVLVKPGTKDAVASRGALHPTTYWVQPDDPDVIVHTELLDPGTSVMVRFVAPAVGKYQFVCTFPGHNFTMFGDFEVTQ